MNVDLVWTSESLDFLEKAGDHSLALNVLVEPFEDDLIVNTIAAPEIIKKIKKLKIIDATYPGSSWYQANEDALKKLGEELELELIHWNDLKDSPTFQAAKEKILKEYYGGEWNSRDSLPDLNFRDLVMAEAAVSAFQYDCSDNIAESLDFVLERCAYICQLPSGETFLCPKRCSSSVRYVINRHSFGVNCLCYEVCTKKKHETGYKHTEGMSKTEVESAVANFMQNEATNLNFFVVDNEGKMIFSNFALEKLVDSSLLAEDIDRTAWQSTREVILTGKTFIGEETRENGYTYLSMKAPLLIDGKIKGAIGLSIDITDSKRIEIEKKRASDLEFLSRLQQVKINFQDEFTQFISQMAHDITSPLASLEVFAKSCPQLTAPQQFLLSSISSSIKSIADDLLKKYRYNKRELDASKKQVLMVSLALIEVINQKRLQYGKNNVHIDLSYDQAAAVSGFINIDRSNFSRMISNLVNNAVEACKERSSEELGIVNINFTIINQNAVIEVSDNGNGMSQEMISKLMEHVPLKTTKKKGCGLGLCQVLENVKLYKGKISVTSKLGKGTQFKVMFPLLKQPSWLTYQLNLPSNFTVLAIDDGTGALSDSSKSFLLNNFAEPNTLHIFGSVGDFEDYMDSMPVSEKEKVFVVMEYRAMNTDSEEILNAILRCNMVAHSLILTEVCNDKRLQDFVEVSGGKMIPKLFLDSLKIINQ